VDQTEAQREAQRWAMDSTLNSAMLLMIRTNPDDRADAQQLLRINSPTLSSSTNHITQEQRERRLADLETSPRSPGPHSTQDEPGAPFSPRSAAAWGPTARGDCKDKDGGGDGGDDGCGGGGGGGGGSGSGGGDGDRLFHTGLKPERPAERASVGSASAPLPYRNIDVSGGTDLNPHHSFSGSMLRSLDPSLAPSRNGAAAGEMPDSVLQSSFSTLTSLLTTTATLGTATTTADTDGSESLLFPDLSVSGAQQPGVQHRDGMLSMPDMVLPSHPLSKNDDSPEEDARRLMPFGGVNSGGGRSLRQLKFGSRSFTAPSHTQALPGGVVASDVVMEADSNEEPASPSQMALRSSSRTSGAVQSPLLATRNVFRTGSRIASSEASATSTGEEENQARGAEAK